MRNDPAYTETPQNFNDVQSAIRFFTLGQQLRERPGFPQKRNKWSQHRRGNLVNLMKKKVFVKIRRGEIQRWNLVKWKPIGSTAGNIWQTWYAAAGHVVDLLGARFFTAGHSVMSPAQIQERVHAFNVRAKRKQANAPNRKLLGR